MLFIPLFISFLPLLSMQINPKDIKKNLVSITQEITAHKEEYEAELAPTPYKTIINAKCIPANEKNKYCASNVMITENKPYSHTIANAQEIFDFLKKEFELLNEKSINE